MRENRLSGSEGGAILISRPYPYSRFWALSRSVGWSRIRESYLLTSNRIIFEAVPPQNTDHYIMKRTASAVWQAVLKKGQGTLSAQSGVLRKTQSSFATRCDQAKAGGPISRALKAAITLTKQVD